MSTKAESILLRIGADASALRRELASGTSSVNVFTKEIDLSRNSLVRFAGVVAAGIGIAKLTGESLEYADAVKKMAQQTDLSTDEVQRLMFIAGQTGASVEGLAGNISKMQRTLSDAGDDGEKARKAISDLGLNINELLQLKPSDQFQKISESIAGIADPADRAAAAQAVLGKSGAEALPMMREMAEHGAELSRRFDELGGPASAAAIDAVDAIGDELAATGVAAKTTATEILAIGGDAIISALKAVQETIGGIRVLMGKGADETTNLTMRVDALTESIAAFDKNNPFPDAFGQKLRDDMEKTRKALLDQMDTMHGLGVAGMSMNVPMQQFGEIMLELPVLTATALGQVDALMEEQFQRMTERNARVQEAQAADMELRRQIIAKGWDDIGEVEGAHYTKMEEFSNKSWDAQVGIVAGSLQEMTAGIAQHSKTAFEVNKASAMATAFVNTAQSVTNALKDYPWPYNLAVAAVNAAAGIAQINAIRSTQFNGGGRGVPPSGATTPATNVAQQGSGGGGGGGGRGDVLNVKGISGDSLFDAKTVRGLADKLLEHQKNGGTVVFEK